VTSKFAKKIDFDLNETWYDVRGRRDIHDDTTFKVIRGQGQGQEMTSVPYRDYFLCMLLVAVAQSFLVALRYFVVTSCFHIIGYGASCIPKRRKR